MPDLTPEDGEFRIGSPSVVRAGTDVVVFATGYMVWKALKAAEALEEKGISLKVVNVSSLKPIDEAAVCDLVNGASGVVTAEEHSIVGGLASAIAFILRSRGMPVECVAIADEFGQSALSYEELLEQYGLTSSAIAEAARKVLGAL
jgi:transketolase